MRVEDESTLPVGKKYTIEEQITAVKREIALRKRVYARRIEEALMDPVEADREIELMGAVLESLMGFKSQDQLELKI